MFDPYLSIQVRCCKIRRSVKWSKIVVGLARQSFEICSRYSSSSQKHVPNTTFISKHLHYLLLNILVYKMI